MARGASLQKDSTPEEPADPTFSPERALEAIGERWSFLILRDAVLHGTTKFVDFERRLSLAPDILGARLDAFVGAGLMDECLPDQDDYCLTDKGRNLEPVVMALSAWADGWDAPREEPSAEPNGENDVVLRESVATASIATQSVQIEIVLLDGFAVTVDGIEVPPLAVGAQRLLAFLALRDRAITRVAMAGAMWPDAGDERAGISLRSALSRLDPVTHDAIVSASVGLSLAVAVVVDFREAQALAHRLLSAGSPASERDLDPLSTGALSAELLPGWYDDWVATEAEDWRQLRVGALEAQASSLLSAGRFADSANAARAAMKVEPLRESATSCLVRAHLAKGNQSEALRAVDLYSDILWKSLALKPTEKLTNLVSDITR
jgi:DNA-binding SARP family transcriptional activator/DNA-binding HxlR family transcriptional regulator